MDGEALGARFARSLAAKDFAAIAGMLDETISFRAMTPGRFWEEQSAPAVVENVLQKWFEPSDHIEEVLDVSTGRVRSRFSARWRFRVTTDGKQYEVEQHAYFDAPAGKISWMRVICSGFVPV
jgi:hypothetical protein